MRILSSILDFFRKIFSSQAAANLNRALALAGPYVKLLMPIVTQIAAIAPGGTLAEALTAYQHFGLSHLFDGDQDPGVLLRDLAVAVVKRMVTSPVASSILNLAVELCVGALKPH